MDQFNIKRDYTNSFSRPLNKEDVRYRKIMRMKFDEELKSILDNTCAWCFHGTTIWNAEKILKSASITSQENNSNKIYVSTIQNVWFTVKHHADLLNFKYPAGCIFVVLPKNEEELQSARNNNQIENVYFKTNPERLKAIITTPENINRVQAWVKESGIAALDNIVMDYEEFLTFAKELNDKSDESIFTK